MYHTRLGLKRSSYVVMFDTEIEIGSNKAIRVTSHSSSAAQIRPGKDVYLEPCKGIRLVVRLVLQGGSQRR